MEKYKRNSFLYIALMFMQLSVVTFAQNTSTSNNIINGSLETLELSKQSLKNVYKNDTTYKISNNRKVLYKNFYDTNILDKKGEAKLLKNPHFMDAIFLGEQKAKSADNNQGLKVLQTARKIIVTDKEIIRGSCWDWPNTVFTRVESSINQRKRLFKGKYGKPPYAPMDMFQAGDWLHFVNLSYHNSAHSAIFIDWLDRDKNIALLASYGGENRNHPARYRAYDVSQVYGVVRSIQSTTE